MSGIPGIKIKVFPAVKTAQSFDFIGNGMGVDDVHDYRDSKRMCLIHEPLELFRGTEAGTESEKIADLIPEGPIVGMLLQGHNLQSIVTKPVHTRENHCAEVIETCNLLLLGTHAYVALIDERGGALASLAMFPFVRCDIPYLCTENFRIRILDYPGSISGKTFRTTPGPLYE